MTDNSVSDFIRTTLAPLIRMDERDVLPEVQLGSFPTWDSLSALKLLMAIEEIYSVRVDPEQLFACETVNDLTLYVKGLSA